MALGSLFQFGVSVQYFSPYVSADLNKMANAFNTTVTSLEDELTQLILDGQISARIDSQKKVRLSNLFHLSSNKTKVEHLVFATEGTALLK